MATKTWYATNNKVSVHHEMSETNPGTEAFAVPTTGWTVSTGAGNHSEMYSQVERTGLTFTTTTPPSGIPDSTNGDCLRSTNAYTGDFASGNWTVHFCVRAQTSAAGQAGRMRCRLLRGANADGSGATEITAAQQQGDVFVVDTTTQDSFATFNPGAFSVANEYIFVQIAWERTGVGAMTTADVNMRIGNASGLGTRVESADFTASTVSNPAGYIGGGWQ